MAFLCISFTKTEIYKDRTMNQIAPISNQTVQAGVQTALNPLTTPNAQLQNAWSTPKIWRIKIGLKFVNKVLAAVMQQQHVA
jgi:hypothetical protein